MTTPELNPVRTALLVLDYQPAILAALPQEDVPGLVDRVAGAIADVRAHGGTVAHVRVGFTEADWDAIPAANKSFAPVARYRAMSHEDPTVAFHERLAPEEGDIVVRKVRYGALSTTDLDRRLRERGIDTLVVAGLSTGGAVLSTVVDAADRDYRLYVLSDGVADPEPEAHRALLERVFPSRAHVVDTAGLRTLLRAA